MASTEEIKQEWDRLFGEQNPDFDASRPLELALEIVGTVHERAAQISHGSDSASRDMALGRLMAAQAAITTALTANNEAAYWAGRYRSELDG